MFRYIRCMPVRISSKIFKASYSSVPQQAEWIKNSKGKEYFIKKENENFEKFYRAQGICPESEWHDMISAMRQPLPSVFRVVATKPEYPHFVSRLREGGLPGVEPVEWFPGGRAWRVTVGPSGSRWDIKDNKELHQFIDDESRLNGNIYRQELVSMVPVLCLDVAPSHTVLDMCASPGSKTHQVLEDMHSKVKGEVPEGVVVANELDTERCSNLLGNIRPMHSPNLIVTRYDGQTFPDIMWTDESGSRTPVRYERIVCDVPCSGDGTIRKNLNIWESWNPVKGNHRHHLQYNIARRGLELLEVGGLMAYSSCSINQIENECVLARLLQEGEGNLELVDQTGKFPGLRWAPGLSSWRVFDDNMNEYASYESVPEKFKSQICSQMFPPPSSKVKDLHLERSMRFLPHHNNDGGFFVAIIRKTGELNWSKTRRQRREKPLKEVSKNKPMKLRHLIIPRDSLNFFGNEENTFFDEAKTFYGIDLKSELFLSRLEGKEDVKKNSEIIQKFVTSMSPDNVSKKGILCSFIRMVSPKVKNILTSNSDEELAVANAGVEVFQREERASSEIKYKLLSKSLHIISKHVTKRIVQGTKTDAEKLMYLPWGESVSMANFDDQFQNCLKDLGFGNFIFVCETKDFYVMCSGFCSQDKVMLDISDRHRRHYMFLLNGN